MPTPTDVAGVKRLRGMVQYIAKFFSAQLLCGHMHTGRNVRVHTTWTVLLSLFAPSFFRTVVAHAKRILRAFRLAAKRVNIFRYA
jgi:hypothetical protein